MKPNRRQFLKAAFASALLTSCRPGRTLIGDAATDAGIPGPYPGRVVSVNHRGSIAAGRFQRAPIRAMVHEGMKRLTGADSPEEAWRVFFEPGDVVGLKLNPVGVPHVISSPEVVQEIIAGLRMAGIPYRDVVAYDRYRGQFLEAGFDRWLPDGVRWTWGTDAGHPLQLDMDGYDPDHYMEMPLVLPDADAANPHHRRSYVARFLTRDVNKMINLSVLKHHQSAGVTLALKNLSHGLVNNVSRSHVNSTLNACGVFIPAVVDLPVIRKKVVLNILDGIRGAYHGGPFGNKEQYVWDHHTLYFATDPVALDKTGWRVIDARRREIGLLPVGEAPPDADSTFYRMQPEHIEIASVLGLGEYRDERIDLREVTLSQGI